MKRDSVSAYMHMRRDTPVMHACGLRLVETFWLLETFVSECLNFN